MKWLTFTVLALLSSLSNSIPSSQVNEVRVAVASNFASTLRALAPYFKHAYGHDLVISSASSGKLFAQIQHGAPFDVFLSADSDKPARLAAVHNAKPFTYAIGRLVLWCPSPCKSPLTSLQSFEFSKLAIANPRLAPYGLAAEQTLQRLTLKQATQPHWVMGENISQTYRFIESGNAPLGFIARAQVQGELNTTQHWLVPEAYHQPIKQDGILLSRAAENIAAQDFIRFIQSATAQGIIRQHGYDVLHD
jgi:molybdenum ABC transporter molybdate-binding protein